jgi:KDO2-lipid IV(A) lauroyltransferase
MREKLEYILLNIFLFIIKILPLSLSYGLFKNLALLLYKLDKKRAKITISNLTQAYPQKSDKEIEQIAKDSYISAFYVLLESLLIMSGKFDIEDIKNLIVNPDEIKKLQDIQSKASKGMIVISGHFGSWELMAHYLGLNDIRLNVIAREGNNDLIDKNFTKPYRQMFGNTQFYKDGAALFMAKALKRNENIALLIDQKTDPKNASMVKFFGRECQTTNSVAQLKLKFDPIVVPVFVVRVEGGYKLIVGEEIDYIASEVDDKKQKIEAITQKYNDIIEHTIDQYTNQWFWMHDRWKM